MIDVPDLDSKEILCFLEIISNIQLHTITIEDLCTLVVVI